MNYIRYTSRESKDSDLDLRKNKYDYEVVKLMRYEGYTNKYIASVIGAPSQHTVCYLVRKLGLPSRRTVDKIKLDAVTGEPI